jgi:hypothetical protein
VHVVDVSTNSDNVILTTCTHHTHGVEIGHAATTGNQVSTSRYLHAIAATDQLQVSSTYQHKHLHTLMTVKHRWCMAYGARLSGSRCVLAKRSKGSSAVAGMLMPSACTTCSYSVSALHQPNITLCMNCMPLLHLNDRIRHTGVYLQTRTPRAIPLPLSVLPLKYLCCACMHSWA